MTDQQERGTNTCAVIIRAVEDDHISLEVLDEMIAELTEYRNKRREGAA